MREDSSLGQNRILGVFKVLDMQPKTRQVLPPALAWPTLTHSAKPPAAEPTPMGLLPLLSSAHWRKDSPTCFRLLTQLMRCARALALARAGRSMAARIAMIA